MYIENLVLKNFRNYSSINIEWNPGMNIIVGENAQGKTNLLESIYFLARGDSFRSGNSELVSVGQRKTVVQGKFQKKTHDETIRIIIENEENKPTTTVIEQNKKKVSSKNALYGNFPVVDFIPQDMSIINEGPDVRRKFIDKGLFHVKPIHAKVIKEYQRTLRQRNELLKQIQSDSSLRYTIDIWDEKLVELGKSLIINRMKFLHELNKKSKVIHRELSDGREDLTLFYISNLIKDQEAIKQLDEVFRKALNEQFDNDIKKGYTSIGPHLDDIKVSINNLDSKRYASQGQRRTCALSLKLSQIEILKEQTGENPIILLDDVMSELDSIRQRKIVEFFKDNQVVITCTDIEHLCPEQWEQKSIFTIQQGNVIKKV
ncbi:MAG TPA: DNA replication/repair protein RecF [Eubacteriaceae bacterium]|nr:DNA replication/repair protein RecF [Eubacteriaceae bacterium]